VTLLYLDASALVKLAREEPHSEALDRFVGAAGIVSCEIAIVELMRAARRAPAIDPRLDAELLRRACAELLESIALVPLDRDVILRAAGLDEPHLRALDALHIASALTLGELDAFVTYDERQSAAARIAGLRTISPQSMT
jgi:predicted nucleic acid-binding protein